MFANIKPYFVTTMTSNIIWTDDYWLLLMQLYLRKPAGVKPMYSRGMVELSLELHVPPHVLYARMFDLRRAGTPRMERLWQTYGDNPKRLARGVRMLRRMQGFSNAEAFYDGVGVNESFEKDFRPIPSVPGMTPMMLIIILDLYFRLTPATMVCETPEIAELARLMRIKAGMVVEVMDVFQACDPYLKRRPAADGPLAEPCRDVWKRFGNGNPEVLSALAAQLKEYFSRP